MKYFARSTVLFLMLYSLLVFAAGNLYVAGGITLPIAARVAIGILIAQLMLAPWLIRRVLDIDWQIGLPTQNRHALEALCRREGIPMPRIGVINCSIPNAFTFGRSQGDACVVVTTGLLESLTVEETDAVIAHQAGHIRHRDFVAITAAAILPMAFYQIHAWMRRLGESSFAARISYVAYWLSELIVLMLNRGRQFPADAFAAQATGNPPALSSALVKICHAISKANRESAWALRHGSAFQKAEAAANSALAGKIGLLGISAPEVGLALTGPGAHAVSRFMKWDLVNPWARLQQYASTHPLTAMRVRELNRLSYRQGRAVTYALPEWGWIEWGWFPVEFLLWAAPWLFGFLMVITAGFALRNGVAVPSSWLGGLAIGVFASWTARIFYRYQGDFEPAAIADLLADTAPSGMRPRATRIEGEIIGHGDPGMFWGPDLLLKDGTGTIFLLGRESVPLPRLFMVPSVERLIGARVVLEGWYRRESIPYVEISRIESAEDPGTGCRSYSRWIQIVHAALGSLALYWLVSLSL